jgi:aminoglycoside phosphotransferase (APT) family kinase protein
MATLGDPLADLGYTLIYWLEPGEAKPGAGVEAAAISAQGGFLTRRELVERYAKASGRDVSAIDFYRVLALTKLAVISEGIFKRFQLGKTAGAGFDKMGRAADPLARRALEIAEAADDPRLRS